VDISIKTNGGLELKIVLSIKNDEEPKKTYFNKETSSKWKFSGKVFVGIHNTCKHTFQCRHESCMHILGR
jgi:hypothetical protein